MDTLTVACVYRTGGVYTPEYVHRLKDAVAQHLPLPHRWVCLSDDSAVATHDLMDGHPGWWAKMELMTLPSSMGNVLYFDLDTVINGDLTPLAEVDELTLLRDFYRQGGLGSGLMLLPPQAREELWTFWEGREREWMARFCIEGDQGFMELKWINTASRWQDLLPGMVTSFKAHSLEERAASRVICYHGTPKPHQTGWAV